MVKCGVLCGVWGWVGGNFLALDKPAYQIVAHHYAWNPLFRVGGWVAGRSRAILVFTLDPS